MSKLLCSSKLQHSHGVTLLAFWGLSSWAEEEEEAVRHQRYRLVSGPVGLFWGWAEVGRSECRGLLNAGHGVVCGDAGEDQCGRPAAAGDGGDGDDREDDYVYDDDVVVVQDWSTPNEVPPRP